MRFSAVILAGGKGERFKSSKYHIFKKYDKQRHCKEVLGGYC